jgi:hypothetical protein
VKNIELRFPSDFEDMFNHYTNDVDNSYKLVYGFECKLDQLCESFEQGDKEHFYKDMFDDNFLEVDQIPSIPKGSYLLVPAENVVKRSQKVNPKSEASVKQDAWEKLNFAIIEEIKSGLQYNRQRSALNIVKYMLNCKDFTFSKNGRSVMLTNQPDSLTSTIDYLDSASRMSGPNELSNPLFIKFTQILLQAKMPKIFVKNKNLLNGQRRNKRKNLKKPFMPRYNQQFHQSL